MTTEVKSVWFTPQNVCIGIVIAKSNHTERAYIGIGNGRDQPTDERQILSWGVDFPLDLAKHLIERG